MTQFTVKSLNDIISDMLLNVVNNVDEVTDLNVGSVLRTMLEAIAQEISLIYEELQNIYDGSRIDTAIEDDLDQLGELVGVTRKEGTESEGYVTFSRNAVATADFTIAQNSIISTQPNTGEEQLRYLVDANTTFSAEITAESTLFVDGVYNYPLNERIIDSISLLSATVSTTPGTPLTETTDFTIESVTGAREIDTSNLETADDCETADWTESTDATADALDAVDYRQGSNSIDLGKSGTTTTEMSYEKILGSVVDSSDKDLHVWVKVEDAPTLAKINTLELAYGSGGSISNSYAFVFQAADLVVGWNLLRVDRT